MWFYSLLASWKSRPFRNRRPQARPVRRSSRLLVEPLENRLTPSFGVSSLAFFNGANGLNPGAGLIMDGGGNLYGTTESGGAFGYGAVFEMAKGSGTITVLAGFNGNNGSNPDSPLLRDSSGNLYGTTSAGGVNGDGTIFELANGSNAITTLASFNGTNGLGPISGLIMDPSGNLYGTAVQGGAYGYGGGSTGYGTVFELAKGSGSITGLASFNGANGQFPSGGVTLDSSGNLYGTARDGGANGYGTVFELANGSGTLTTVVSFSGGSNGAYPYASLIMDASGNFYGTTAGGDTNDYGTVFELARGSSTITTLASLTRSGAWAPQTGLLMDSSGNLYGTASAGGASGYGTVFELPKGASSLTTLAAFDASNGSDPLGPLVMDSSGNLYGTTAVGGEGFQDVYVQGDGTVFEVIPHTAALNWSTPASINYDTALSSTQLDATAADSVTGATVAGTFVYSPPTGTILHGGSQTLSVTFTPTDTVDYSPITTRVSLVVNQLTPALTWNTPASIPDGTPLTSTQLDATAADPVTGASLSGTFVYTPPAGTILGNGINTLNVTYTPADASDYTTATASVTLVVGHSTGIATLGMFNYGNGSETIAGEVNGVEISAGLLMDSSGNLYGTTPLGGTLSGGGDVFEVAAGSGSVTALASFNGANGAFPTAGLVMDASGNLYGTTISNGASRGTVFELPKGSGAVITLAGFDGTNGSNPDSPLIRDSSGNLYGTTCGGGANGDGTIFELANGSGTITTLASFDGSNGVAPIGALVQDQSGDLYGTTSGGGASSDGTVFELAAGSGAITTVASFNGSNGAGPTGIVMNSNGNLYGTAQGGGANNDGTAFEVAKGSNTITLLASFNGDNGMSPNGTVSVDNSGNLYGTTSGGGASRDGTVFELRSGSSTPDTLAAFDPETNNGGIPVGGLITDSSGNLYGMTLEGGEGRLFGAEGDGIVFELVPRTPAVSWSAPAAINYGTALTSTQLDATAPVAGTFTYTPPAGTIPHAGWQTLTVAFTPTDTADYSPLTTRVGIFVNQVTPVMTWITPASITYGTPLSGTQLDATAADPSSGSLLAGTFAYTPPAGTIVGRGSTIMSVTFTPADTTDYTTATASVTLVVKPAYSISDFSFKGTNGSEAGAGLIMDSSGNLYGTTLAGGSGYGTVFELASGARTITSLASFNGANGQTPAGALIMDTNGNLYGTTKAGGKNGDGTVFELVKGSTTITTLLSFNGSNGADPVAGLIMDSSGNFYGTTESGGAYGDGTIFKLSSKGALTTLAPFNGSNGYLPVAGLVMDSSGDLYGATEYGGIGFVTSDSYPTGDGIVFEFIKASNTITILVRFNGSNGIHPEGGLIMDQSGNLYGTTYAGGAHDDGTVFELGAGSGLITAMLSFAGSNGSGPIAGVILDRNGNLYGTTSTGGANGDGTVFEVGAGSGAITCTVSFAGNNGADPVGGVIIDQNGNLYGTAEMGGAFKDGAVFELPAVVQKSYAISGFPASTSAGTAQTFTLTVLNPDGTTDAGYTGTVHFTSTDPQAVLPIDYTFTAADAGVHTFAATLKTAGAQSIMATDTISVLIAGSVSTTVTPAAASVLLIGGPSAVTSGVAFSITVTVLDAYGNVATGYTGTVHFSSSDTMASLPANYTFQPSDYGAHTFSGLVLFNSNKKSITALLTATDTLFSSIVGSLSVRVS
jgi:uncharacterized repeat protein (TIGR03803 family)